MNGRIPISGCNFGVSLKFWRYVIALFFFFFHDLYSYGEVCAWCWMDNPHSLWAWQRCRALHDPCLVRDTSGMKLFTRPCLSMPGLFSLLKTQRALLPVTKNKTPIWNGKWTPCPLYTGQLADYTSCWPEFLEHPWPSCFWAQNIRVVNYHSCEGSWLLSFVDWRHASVPNLSHSESHLKGFSFLGSIRIARDICRTASWEKVKVIVLSASENGGMPILGVSVCNSVHKDSYWTSPVSHCHRASNITLELKSLASFLLGRPQVYFFSCTELWPDLCLCFSPRSSITLVMDAWWPSKFTVGSWRYKIESLWFLIAHVGIQQKGSQWKCLLARHYENLQGTIWIALILPCHLRQNPSLSFAEINCSGVGFCWDFWILPLSLPEELSLFSSAHFSLALLQSTSLMDAFVVLKGNIPGFCMVTGSI